MRNKVLRGIAVLLSAALLTILLSGAALAATVRGTSGNSYIRSQPSLSGEKLGTLPKGASAEYLGKQAKDNRGVIWYNVRYKGISGWVSSRYTSLSGASGSNSSSGSGQSGSSGTNQGSAPVDPYQSDYVLASKGEADIRSTPSPNGNSLGKLPMGATAEYIATSDPDALGFLWYKIVYGQITGWVSSEFTSRRSPVSGSEAGAGGAAFGAPAAGSGSGNVASGDDLSNALAGAFGGGSAASGSGSSQAGASGSGSAQAGASGSGNSQAGASGSGSSSGGSKPASDRVVVGTSGSSNIRSIPTLSGKVLGTFPKGATATYVATSKPDSRGVIWYKITYGKITGWVSSRYTTLK